MKKLLLLLVLFILPLGLKVFALQPPPGCKVKINVYEKASLAETYFAKIISIVSGGGGNCPFISGDSYEITNSSAAESRDTSLVGKTLDLTNQLVCDSADGSISGNNSCDGHVLTDNSSLEFKYKKLIPITATKISSNLNTETKIETETDLEDLFSDTSLQNGVDCFDYYKFQSVQVNVGPNKSAFTAGEDVDFSGKIENENKYPVFNGYVYVRIAEKNPAYINEGHNIVDEFIALGPIALDASSSLPVSFSWKIPENLKTGEYTASYFFSVNKKMNLGGLPFTNEIIVGFSDFSIASTKTGNVSFLKSSTKVNTEKYNHIGNWPFVEQGGKAVVSQVIQNTLKQDLKTEISYSLYFWDSLDSKDLISTKKESITLKAGESKTINYEIPKVELSVYYLQIVAKNENGTKSVVNIRITSDASRPRINYFGLDNFPIQKGATTTLYSCFHNTSNVSASGTTVLIAKDKAGREISKVEYVGIIPSSISAQKSDFVANSNLDYLKLEQKIYDGESNLLDTQEIIYDISLIKKPEIKAEPINPIIVAVLAGLIIFGFLMFIIRPIRKNKNLCLVISLVIISLAGALIVLFMQARPVKAQSTIENFAVSQSKSIVKSFTLGWVGDVYNKVLKDANVQYNYTINTTAVSPILKVGDTFSFTHSALGTFNGTGGYSDTPYLGQKLTYDVGNKDGKSSFTSSMEAAKWVPFVETFKYKGACMGSNKNGTATDCIGGAYGENGLISAARKAYNPNPSDSRYGYRKQSDIPQFGGAVAGRVVVTTTKYIKSETIFGTKYGYNHRESFVPDSSVIDCTSGVCRAVGPGTAIVRAKINPSEVILGYNYPTPMRLYKEVLTEGFRDSIPFEGFTASWEFKVEPAGVLPPSGKPRTSTTTTTTCGLDNWVCDNNWAPTSCPPSEIQTQSCVNNITSTTTCPTTPKSEPLTVRSCTYILPVGVTSQDLHTACSATQGTSTKIYVNKQTQWMVGIPSGLSNSDIIKTEWSGTNISSKSTTANILSNIYTTVGLKNISATTTAIKNNVFYTITCSSSTNVIFGVGSVIER